MIHPLRFHDAPAGPSAGPSAAAHALSREAGAPVALGPLVIKLGGLAVDEPEKTPWLWSLLRDLHDAHPGGLVLVHGGAVAVDRQLARLGHETRRVEGIRVTPAEQIDDIVGVLAGSVNTTLVGWLRRSGAPAVGLTLGDGGLCRVARTSRYAFDPGHVGEIVGGDPRVVDALLNADFLPVLCSIGVDASGEALNVNADEAAAGIAGIVGASGVLLLTDVKGVRGADGEVIPELDAAAIERLIADGTISGGMIPKVRGALEAAATAGVPVIIAAWNDETSLRRVAAGESAGTRILPPRRATLDEPEMPALASSAAAASRTPASCCCGACGDSQR